MIITNKIIVFFMFLSVNITLLNAMENNISDDDEKKATNNASNLAHILLKKTRVLGELKQTLSKPLIPVITNFSNGYIIVEETENKIVIKTEASDNDKKSSKRIHTEESYHFCSNFKDPPSTHSMSNCINFLPIKKANALRRTLRDTPYTQSQAHLAHIMGEEKFKSLKGDSKLEVLKFLEKYSAWKELFTEKQEDELTNTLSLLRNILDKNVLDSILSESMMNNNEDIAQLQKIFIAALEEEKQIHNRDKIVFYHASNSAISFLYDFISVLTAKIKILDSEKFIAVRGNYNKFMNFVDVDDFIRWIFEGNTYASDSFRNAVNNTPLFSDNTFIKDNMEYKNVAFSANPFLFGNNDYEGECTYLFFAALASVGAPKIDEIIGDLAKAIGLKLDIEKYKKLYDKYYIVNGQKNGKLMQIFVDPQVADVVAYSARSFGYVLNVDVEGIPGYRGISRHMAEIRTSPEAFNQRLNRAKEHFEGVRGPNINSWQIRIFPKPQIFHDPRMVNIKTYWRYPVTPEAEQRYRHELGLEIEKDLAEWLKAEVNPQDFTFEAIPPLQKLYQYTLAGETKASLDDNRYTGIEKKLLLAKAMLQRDYSTVERILTNEPDLVNQRYPSLYSLEPFDDKVIKDKRFSYSLADFITSPNQESDRDMIKYLIEHGLNPNSSVNDRGEYFNEKTSLLIKWGINKQDKEIVDLLLDKGAKINRSTVAAALRYVMYRGHHNNLPILKQIMNKVEQKDKKLNSFDYIDLPMALLQLADCIDSNGQNVNDVIEILLFNDKFKEYFGVNNWLEFFLQSNANNIFTIPLLKLVLFNPEHRYLLLQHLDLQRLRKTGVLIEELFNQYHFVIDAFFAYEDTQNAIIEALANRTKIFNPFHWAVANKRPEILGKLLNNKMACKIFLSQENIVNKRGHNPLYLAIKYNDIDSVAKLLDSKNFMKQWSDAVQDDYQARAFYLSILSLIADANNEPGLSIAKVLFNNHYFREIATSHITKYNEFSLSELLINSGNNNLLKAILEN